MLTVRERCADPRTVKILKKNLVKFGFNGSAPLIGVVTTFQDAVTMVKLQKHFEIIKIVYHLQFEQLVTMVTVHRL
jgi:hypothetical protein